MGGSKSKPLSEQESTRVLAMFTAMDRDNDGFLNEEVVPSPYLHSWTDPLQSGGRDVFLVEGDNTCWWNGGS